MVTMADLFMLLLTFFVLLLSFTVMDAERYRLAAQSVMTAFDVSLRALQPDPKGMVDPEELAPPLDQDIPIPFEGAPASPAFGPERLDYDPLDLDVEIDSEIVFDDPDWVPADVEIDSGIRMLVYLLHTELDVAQDAVQIGFDQERVVIRFSEHATFPSGRADLIPEVRPVIQKLGQILAICDVDTVVTGHTDDVPISTSLFRSNWDLSVVRAVSVVHELLASESILEGRTVAAGRAETHPLAPNDTPENRALNRRVEISIYEPNCDPSALDRDDLPELISLQ
jgi:chemotaxis protein MotB